MRITRPSTKNEHVVILKQQWPKSQWKMKFYHLGKLTLSNVMLITLVIEWYWKMVVDVNRWKADSMTFEMDEIRRLRRLSSGFATGNPTSTCRSSQPWPWLWRAPQFAILHQRCTPIPSIPYLVPVPIILQWLFWIPFRLRCSQTARFEPLWNHNSGLQTNSSLLLHWQQWTLRRRKTLLRSWNRSHLEFFLCVWVRCCFGIERYCFLSI